MAQARAVSRAFRCVFDTLVVRRGEFVEISFVVKRFSFHGDRAKHVFCHILRPHPPRAADLGTLDGITAPSPWPSNTSVG